MSLRTVGPVVASVSFFALLLGGCAQQEGGSASKAETVFKQTMEADPQYAQYGVTLASESEDPISRQVLIETMTSGSYRAALGAVHAIAQNPTPEVEGALREIYQNKKGALRLQAAIGLARLGDAEALEWVRSETSGGGMLNLEAAALLAEVGGEEDLLPILTKLTQNDDLSVRNEAYGILGELKQPWATELLRERLDEEHGEERLQAIISLGRAGDPAVAAEIQRFTNTQGLVFASIEALGELGNADSVAPLSKLREHEEDLVRVYVGTALWKLGEAELARETLTPLLASEDATVRQNLAEQLGAVRQDGAVELLAELAGDSEREVRLAAVRGLKNRPTAATERVLLAALEDQDYEVVSLALTALGSSGSSECLPSVEPRLDDENPYVALSAASAVLGVQHRSGAAG